MGIFPIAFVIKTYQNIIICFISCCFFFYIITCLLNVQVYDLYDVTQYHPSLRSYPYISPLHPHLSPSPQYISPVTVGLRDRGDRQDIRACCCLYNSFLFVWGYLLHFGNCVWLLSFWLRMGSGGPVTWTVSTLFLIIVLLNTQQVHGR